jgi:hypothetical protein
MYVSVEPKWFVSTGRIEKHTFKEGKLVKEYIGSFKKKEDADKIVEFLNKEEVNDSKRIHL